MTAAWQRAVSLGKGTMSQARKAFLAHWWCSGEGLHAWKSSSKPPWPSPFWRPCSVHGGPDTHPQLFLSQTGGRWRKQAEPMPITSISASGLGEAAAPTQPGLPWRRAAAITAPLCLCPKQKLPTTLCSWKSPDQPSPSPTQVPGDKAVRRPNGVQKQSWDCSHTWFGLFFVPGKPPHTPNSTILRLSGSIKTLVVFLTDSLVRRLSLALFLTLTVGHPKGSPLGAVQGLWATKESAAPERH